MITIMKANLPCLSIRICTGLWTPIRGEYSVYRSLGTTLNSFSQQTYSRTRKGNEQIKGDGLIGQYPTKGVRVFFMLFLQTLPCSHLVPLMAGTKLQGVSRETGKSIWGPSESNCLSEKLFELVADEAISCSPTFMSGLKHFMCRSLFIVFVSRVFSSLKLF